MFVKLYLRIRVVFLRGYITVLCWIQFQYATTLYAIQDKYRITAIIVSLILHVNISWGKKLTFSAKNMINL
jgi:hypothetical protein